MGCWFISPHRQLVKAFSVCAFNFRSYPIFEQLRNYCFCIIDIHHHDVFVVMSWYEWELACLICVEIFCVLYSSIYILCFHMYWFLSLGISLFFLMVASSWPDILLFCYMCPFSVTTDLGKQQQMFLEVHPWYLGNNPWFIAPTHVYTVGIKTAQHI